MAAPTIVASLKQFFASHAPYSELAEADLDYLIAGAEMAYFAPGDQVLAPQPTTPERFFIVKQGRVRGLLPHEDNKIAFEARGGDSFPVGALLADRPVTLTYVAVDDTFALVIPSERFHGLVRRSEIFAAFCNRRLGALLDLSRQQMQASYAAEANSERSLGMALAQLIKINPVTCRPDESLRDVFVRMNDAKVGSVLVTESSPADSAEKLIGILTRTDLIGRVILPQVPLTAPVSQVMSRDVLSLDESETAADAGLLMAQHGIRHVPVTRRTASGSELVGIVSERDLFALQRLSLRQLADEVRGADDVEALSAVARDIRELSYYLVAQGVGAESLTRLISHLNDQLTERLVLLATQKFDVDPDSFCWLALGSEGRGEQTISTDQDNGILYVAGQSPERLLAMADWINVGLDRCGYPLCRGNIMARNPRWCLDGDGWTQLFAGWIDRGDPQALLNASVFFDFRGLVGNVALATRLREHVVRRAQGNQRFLKQMADNALRNRAPAPGGLLDALLGADGRFDRIDLKMHGTVPFVDAARIWALGAGLAEVNTAGRLRTLCAKGALPVEDVTNWIDAFDFLQLMRLRVQHARSRSGERGEDNPNVVDPAQLSVLDRRSLKESFRQARKVQLRLELDFP